MNDRMPTDWHSGVLAGEWDAAADPLAEKDEASQRGSLWKRAWVRRYGGYPVAVRIGTRVYARRLFVGGRERTMRPPRLAHARPAVDVIVNLCDLPDHAAVAAPNDSWWPRGEGPLGYRPDVLLRDAQAVAELLRRGETVLIHCVWGVNRAPTLATAVVMVLEGCSAREALRRVRRHRWMAFPDPWHWRSLRQLQTKLAAGRNALANTSRSA
jgi:Dual specificity phosphatase, catalytic domain